MYKLTSEMSSILANIKELKLHRANVYLSKQQSSEHLAEEQATRYSRAS